MKWHPDKVLAIPLFFQNPDNRKEEYKTVGIKGYAGTYTENMLRADANFPQRTKYFADD